MSPIEWFTLLSPLALTLIGLDILLLFLIEKNSAAKFIKLSLAGYAGIAIGWLIMNLGISLNSLSALMKTSILGWLILLPMLLFTGINFVRKLFQPKNKLGRGIFNTLIFSVKAFSKFIRVVSTLLIDITAKADKNNISNLTKPYQPIYANPINRDTPGIQQTFPNELQASSLDVER